MPSDINTEELLRSYRRAPLFDPSAFHKLRYGREDIMRLIPHRDPLLYVDEITAIDYDSASVVGARHINRDDPLLRGHFPDYPVYPGCSLVESIGQLSLCLYALTMARAGDAHNERSITLTRILGAAFVRPVPPDTHLVMYARGFPMDGFFYRAIGQALVDGQVAAVMIAEVVPD